jgi:hypothetical protein
VFQKLRLGLEIDWTKKRVAPCFKNRLMMKSDNRRHHTRILPEGSTRKVTLRRVERFFLNYGLGFAGAVILLTGVAYLVINHFGNDKVMHIIESILKPGRENEFNPGSVRIPVSMIVSLTLLYLPGFFPLAAIFLLPGNRSMFRTGLGVAGFVWLIFITGKVFLFNAYNYGVFFPGFWAAVIFFLIVEILLLVIAITAKSRTVLNLSVLYFFISVALIRSYFGGLMPFFLILIVFLCTTFFFTIKFRWRSAYVTLVTFSFLYIGYYTITKIILINDPGPVPYVLPALIVWLVVAVTGVAILKPVTPRKIIMPFWDGISYVSPFIVIGLSYFAIKITGTNLFSPLCNLLIVILMTGLAVYNERYSYFRSRRGFYFAVCILVASIIPLFMFPNFLLIFIASLTVTILVHANLTHSNASFNFSVFLYLLSLFIYVVEWGITFIPALSSQRASGDIYPLSIVLTSLMFASLLYFYTKVFQYIAVKHKSMCRRVILSEATIEFLLPFILFSSLFLTSDFLLVSIFKGYRLNYIEGATLAYGFILFLLVRRPARTEKMLVIRVVVSYIMIALYPVIVQPEVILFLNQLLGGVAPAIVPFVLHYLCLGIVIALLVKANRDLIRLFPHTREAVHYIKMTVVLVAAFILLSEYDHFSLLWPGYKGSLAESEILRTNHFVPYSVILLFISVSLMIYSLIRYSRFLRRVSLIMIILVIAKIFIFDLRLLKGNNVVLLLISVGLILIGLAITVRIIRHDRNVVHHEASS